MQYENISPTEVYQNMAAYRMEYYKKNDQYWQKFFQTTTLTVS